MRKKVGKILCERGFDINCFKYIDYKVMSKKIVYIVVYGL